MRLFDKEEILFQTENEQFTLTNQRMRLVNDSFSNSAIKSVLLRNITSCELTTVKHYAHLRSALLIPFLINAIVYMVNHYWYKAIIIKILFGDVRIDGTVATAIFALSIGVGIYYLIQFARSVKRVFSFNTDSGSIKVQINWFSAEDRESFISLVEELILKGKSKSQAPD